MADTAILAQQLLQIIPPVMQTVAAELRKTGLLLSPSHFGVMVMLHLHTCNLSELAEYQGVSLPTMSSTVSRLEERGWVRRERDANDRRVVRVKLTASGKRKLSQISEQAEARMEMLLTELSDEDRQELGSGLEILRRLFGVVDLQENGSPSSEDCD